jgi:hypothetical protein
VRTRHHHVEPVVALAVDISAQGEGEVLQAEADLRDAVAAGDVRAGLPLPQRQDLLAKHPGDEVQVTEAVAAVQSEVGLAGLAQALQERQQPVETLGEDALEEALRLESPARSSIVTPSRPSGPAAVNPLSTVVVLPVPAGRLR